MLPSTVRVHPAAVRLAIAAALPMLLAACVVPRTAEQMANSAAPTPGSATLRSLAVEAECRTLSWPEELPSVAALVDTAALQRAFPDTLERAFGLTFNRLGNLEEARHLEANSLGMDMRRETLDRFYPAVRAQQPGVEWSVRVEREAGADTWQVDRSVFCPAQFVLRDQPGSRGIYSVRFLGEVHVTVTPNGSPDAVYTPEVRSREDNDRNRVIASGLRFVAATLNGEPVQSVVIFGREGWARR